MSNTIQQNLNTGNQINTGGGGGTIGSVVKGEGLSVKLSSPADYKPQIAANVAQQAEQAFVAGEARAQIAQQLYSAPRAAREGYGGKSFDPEKTKAIQRGLTTIKPRTAPPGLNQSLSAGIFSGAAEDFNKYILGESQRGIREQVNLYLDFQNFSGDFREKYRISPDRDGKLDFDQVWSPEIQREGQIDLIRQRERGNDQVDSVFRSNNPWYQERKADTDLEREYRNYREQGLTPQQAAERLQPKLPETYSGEHYFPGTFELAGVDSATYRAKNPKAYAQHYEGKYQSFKSAVEKPLEIDFSKAPISIPWAHPMQAEWNRQNYEASKAERNLQENPNDPAAKLTGVTGITSPQQQQQMAEKYGYNSWRELATSHFDFKSHQAALPKFSETDKNVYYDGGGNPFVTNAKALTAAGGGALTVDYVGNTPLNVSENTNNLILPAIATSAGGKTTNYDPAGIFSEGNTKGIEINHQLTAGLQNGMFADYSEKFKDGSYLGQDATKKLTAYNTRNGNTLFVSDANGGWRNTPASNRLSDANIRGDHTLYVGGGASQSDILRHLEKLDKQLGKTESSDPFGVNSYNIKTDSDYLTIMSDDKHYLTTDSGKLDVFTLPKGSIIDKRDLNNFETVNQESLKAAGLVGNGNQKINSVGLVGGALSGIDAGIKNNWWSIQQMEKQWLPTALNSSTLTPEVKTKLKETVKSEIEGWQPTGDVIDAALLIGGAGVAGKLVSSGGKLGGKVLSPTIRKYEKLQDAYRDFATAHDSTAKIFSAGSKTAKAAVKGAVGVGTVGLVYDQTPNEKLLTYGSLVGKGLEDAYKPLKYTAFDENTGKPAGYRSDVSPSRLLGLLAIGAAESPQMVEKSYRGAVSLGGDALSKGIPYASAELVKRGSQFLTGMVESARYDPAGTLAEMIGVTGGASAIASAGKTGAKGAKYATGTYNLDTIGQPNAVVTTTSPLNKLIRSFGAENVGIEYGHRVASSTTDSQYKIASQVAKHTDTTLQKYIDPLLKVQIKPKPDVSGGISKYLDLSLHTYGKREISDAGLIVKNAKYAVPTVSAGQTLTKLGDGTAGNTNWLLPIGNNVVKSLSPTLAEIIPKTASTVTIIPVKNTQSANKPLIGDVLGEIKSQASVGNGYNIAEMANAMISAADGKNKLFVSPTPKAAKRPTDYNHYVEPEFLIGSQNAKVKVESIKKAGRVPETDQKVYSVSVDGVSYANDRKKRIKENLLGARLDLQTTVRGIPDGRIYNTNTAKIFDADATTSGLSKFSGLDELVTDTKHGKQHVLAVEDNALRLIERDPKYAKADRDVISVSARLHDTLRTLDYDSITRGSHGQSLRRAMMHGNLKTSDEFLSTLKPDDASSLSAHWGNNEGVKLWDETVKKYRGMTPKQQKQVRNAIGLHTAAKSNIRTSVLMPVEAKIISDADRLELARFNGNKQDWLPKQRKMFTSQEVQKQILSEKYGKMYPDNKSGGRKRIKGKSDIRNAVDGIINFGQGMITPSEKIKRNDPDAARIYGKYKANYGKSLSEIGISDIAVKSAAYASGKSSPGRGATVPAYSPVEATAREYPNYYSSTSRRYGYAAVPAVYDYTDKTGVYDYRPAAAGYQYKGKSAGYEYAAVPAVYDNTAKVTGYDYIPKTDYGYETGKSNSYKGVEYRSRNYSAPYGRSDVYKSGLIEDDLFKPKLYKHDYPTPGRKRKKQRIKAAKVFHREIQDPLEVLSVGSMTNPYLKDTYSYKGDVKFEWDSLTGTKITNTLKAPKTPKQRTVIYDSKLEKEIGRKIKRNKLKAAVVGGGIKSYPGKRRSAVKSKTRTKQRGLKGRGTITSLF